MMSNFPRKPDSPGRPHDLAEVITPAHIEFIGEQTSPRDDAIKATLRSIFERAPRVFERVYLARVSYGEPGVSSVALCARNIGRIEQTLQKGFKHMFGEVLRKGDFYDWMVIDENQERELKKVCKPFYEAAQPEH